MPLNVPHDEKISLNALGCGVGVRSQAICFARANHACNSNAKHYFDEVHDVKIIFSVREIKCGEEIFINYRISHLLKYPCQLELHWERDRF